MNEQEQPQTPQSYIQILFKEPGNVMYDIRASGITPGQFLAMAEVLRLMGEAGFAQEQLQRAEARKPKIAVPNAPIISDGFPM